MPEILTESFCERCGTRYTFESATPRGPRLKGLKVVSRGLKNFVLSDDTSMDEAMAAARSETDREATSHQLDAFHKTFSFCMNCRQYTCGNCWNEVEGRCLSCAPHLGHEILPAPFPNVPGTAIGAIGANGANGHVADDQNGREELPRLDPLAWPASDLMADEDLPAAVEAIEAVEGSSEPIDGATGAVDASEPVVPEAVAVVEPAPIEPAISMAADPLAEPAAESPAVLAADWPSDPIGVDDRAAAAATQTSDLLHRFRPGQSLDAEIDAFERDQADDDEPPTPMPVAAAEPQVELAPVAAAEPQVELAPVAAAEPQVELAPEPEPVAAAEPEPEVVAAAEPEPEPVAAAEPQVELQPEPEPVAAAEPQVELQPEPEPVAAAEPEPRDDVVAQPTWQIIAPDSPTADGVQAPTMPSAPQPPTQPIAASAEPQWPSKPEWPSQRPAASLPFLGRPVVPTGGIEALWAESAREVTAAAGTAPVTARATSGVQPCVSCGLSLSANARFCRRCGSRQG